MYYIVVIFFAYEKKLLYQPILRVMKAVLSLIFSINIFVLLDTSKNTLICVNIVGIGKESLAY